MLQAKSERHQHSPPTPTPGDSTPVVTTPLLGFVPVVQAPPGLQLAVMDGGVRMPVIEEEEAPVAAPKPPARVAPPVPPAPKPPVVPVYPPKQARN